MYVPTPRMVKLPIKETAKDVTSQQYYSPP